MNTLNQNGLMKTSDLSIFKLLETNREIHEKHVETLTASLQNNNDLHLNPIIVDSEMRVIDGQHRLEAAKKLGLDMYYVIDDDFSPEKLIVFNTTQKKWSLFDYFTFWKNQGREEYFKLDEFMKEMGLSLNNSLRWVGSGHSEKLLHFRQGRFHFKLNQEKFEALMNTIKMIDFMKENNFRQKSIYNQSAFHDAAREFFTNKLVDGERFLERLHNTPFNFTYSSNSYEYVDQFVEIYNYNQRKKRLGVVTDGKRKEFQLI